MNYYSMDVNLTDSYKRNNFKTNFIYQNIGTFILK